MSLLQSQFFNSSLDLSRMFSRLSISFYSIFLPHICQLSHTCTVFSRSIELLQLLHIFADASICLVNLVIKCEELHLWKSLLILPCRIRHTFTYAIIFSCAYIHNWLLKSSNLVIFLSYEDNISVWIQEPYPFFLSLCFLEHSKISGRHKAFK